MKKHAKNATGITENGVRKNPKKVREYQRRFWEKKAQKNAEK